ncbi:hypothetical protein QFC20_004516 [Naganishia adeliensis]|uniref:Uncharacterized protein n=1 Tax=Naganishia adeliensis TaxID=92952 RepID=A0ACC2VY22_9TREE|nr:hypothetical protein QFC20_004516 [Naganishia adeliensis]
MRFSNLALFALSAVPLSVLASPVAQYSPTAEDSLSTATEVEWFPMPTMMPIEDPSTTDTGFMTIQTSMPDGETTDTGFMTIQTSMPAEVTTSDGGMFTIQTSTPAATPTATADECQATDVDEESEDDDDEWCDEDEDQGEDPSTSATEAPTSTSSDYPIATPPSSSLATGIYQIYPVGALISMCLQIQEGQEPADGTPVVIAPCDGSPEQDWLRLPRPTAQWYPPAGNLYIKLVGSGPATMGSFNRGGTTRTRLNFTSLIKASSQSQSL